MVATLVLVLSIGLPLLSGLGAYVITMLSEIKAAEAQDREAAVERDLETGFSLLSHHHVEDASYAEAIDAFDRALDKKSDCVEAVAGRALGLNGQKRYQECLDFLDQQGPLLKRYPDLERLRTIPLFHLHRKTEFEALEARFRERTTTTALGHFVAGGILMRNCGRQKDRGVFKRALDHFTRANLCSPHIRPMYVFQLAHAAGHLADDREVRQVVRVLEARYEDSPVAWFRAGWALWDVDTDEAIRAYEKAIVLESELAHSQNREWPLVYQNLGVLYSKKGRSTGRYSGTGEHATVIHVRYARVSISVAHYARNSIFRPRSRVFARPWLWTRKTPQRAGS